MLWLPPWRRPLALCDFTQPMIIRGIRVIRFNMLHADHTSSSPKTGRAPVRGELPPRTDALRSSLRCPAGHVFAVVRLGADRNNISYINNIAHSISAEKTLVNPFLHKGSVPWKNEGQSAKKESKSRESCKKNVGFPALLQKTPKK